MEPNFQGDYAIQILDVFYELFRYGRRLDIASIKSTFEASGFDKEEGYPEFIQLLERISPDMRYEVWPELNDMPNSWC